MTSTRYVQNRNVGKQNNLNLFGSNKIKGPVLCTLENDTNAVMNLNLIFFFVCSFVLFAVANVTCLFVTFIYQ